MKPCEIRTYGNPLEGYQTCWKTPEDCQVPAVLLREAAVTLILVNPCGPDTRVNARKNAPLHDAIALYVGDWWRFRSARARGLLGMVVRDESGKPLATGLTVENLGLKDGTRLFPEPDGPPWEP